MSKSKTPNFRTPNPIAEHAELRKKQTAGNTAYSKRIVASKEDYDQGRGSKTRPYTNPDEGLGKRVRDTRGLWKEKSKLKAGESNWFTDKARFDEATPPTERYTVTLTGLFCDVYGAGVYEVNKQVILRAVPYDGYAFEGWYRSDGTFFSGDELCILTVTADVTLYAVAKKIIPEHAGETFVGVACAHGTVNITPAGSSAVPGAGYYYDTAGLISISVVVDAGYKLTGWRDSEGRTYRALNPLTYAVTLPAATEFKEIWFYALVEKEEPETYTITANGINCTVTGSGTYQYGDEVTLTVIPFPDYKFTNWADGYAYAPRKIVVTGDATYTAICVIDKPVDPDYVLVEYSAQNGTVTLTASDIKEQGDGYAYVKYNTSVTLSCVADYGYEFVSWSDGHAANPYTFIAKARTLIVGICEEIVIPVGYCYCDAAGAGCSVTGSGTYAWGATATFTAAPMVGYVFQGWYVDGVLQAESTTTLTLTVPSKEYCTVHAYAAPEIEPEEDQVAIIALGAHGFATGTGVYKLGDEVTVEYHPEDGYTFVRWTTETGAEITKANPYTFTVTDSMIGNTYYYVANSESDDPYVKKYTVTTSAINGTVAISPSSSTFYYKDTFTVTFTPKAAVGETQWEFDRFLVNGNPIFDNPATLTVYGDMEIIGVGVQKEDPKPGSGRINIEVSPQAGGDIEYVVADEEAVTVKEAILDKPEGTSIKLTALAATDYSFSHWSDYLKSAASRTEVFTNYPQTFVSVFKENETPIDKNRLTLHTTNGTMEIKVNDVEVTAGVSYYDGFYAKNSKVEVYVTATEGHKFRWWWKDGTRLSQNPMTFILSADYADYAFCGIETYRVYVPVSPFYTASFQGKNLVAGTSQSYGEFTYGELCAIHVEPNVVEDEGYCFDHWSVATGNSDYKDLWDETDQDYYFIVEQNMNIKPIVHGSAVRVSTHDIKSGTDGYSDVYLDLSHYESGKTIPVEYSIDEGQTWNVLTTDKDNPMQFKGTLLLRNNEGTTTASMTNPWLVCKNGANPGDIKEDASGGYNDPDVGVKYYARLAFGTKPGDNALLTISGRLSTLTCLHPFSTSYGMCASNIGACGAIFCDNEFIADASKLILPTDRITDTTESGYTVKKGVRERVFQRLFKNCINLHTAPSIEATKVGGFAFAEMFENCINLINPPYVGATDIYDGRPVTFWFHAIYKNMFKGCVQLKTPINMGLPHIHEGGCQNMYQGCEALTYMPAIPTTVHGYEEGGTSYTITLSWDHAYERMFKDCTSLKQVVPLDNDVLNPRCYSQMFEGCTSLERTPMINVTRFYKQHDEATTKKEGYMCNRMFYGCSNLRVVNIAGCSDYWNSDNTPYHFSQWLVGAGSAVPQTEKKYFYADQVTKWHHGGSRSTSSVPSDFELRPTYLIIEPLDGNPLNVVLKCNTTTTTSGKPVLRTEISYYYWDDPNDAKYKYDQFNPHVWNNHDHIMLTNEWDSSKGEVVFKAEKSGPVVFANTWYIDGSGTYDCTGCSMTVRFPDPNTRVKVSGCLDAVISHLDTGTHFREFYRGMFDCDDDARWYPAVVDARDCIAASPYRESISGGTMKTGVTMHTNHAFQNLFRGQSNMTSFPYLRPTLPHHSGYAEFYNEYAFASAFEGCSSVTEFTSPYLGTTTMTAYPYSFNSTFKGCASLKYAPVINFPNIGAHAFESMFENCTSLVTAPYGCTTQLIGEAGCRRMFYNCTSLSDNGYVYTVTAPYAYESICEGCSGIGLSSSKTFATLSSNITWLPEGCFKNAYKGCTNLKTPLLLSSLTQVNESALEGCYESSGVVACSAVGDYNSNLSLGKRAFARIWANCDNLKAGFTISPIQGIFGGIQYYRFPYDEALCETFAGCSSLIYSPAIPHAISDGTQANRVFAGMFKDCTSLESTPTLYCRLLNENAFVDMFKGCSSLYAVHTNGLVVDEDSISGWLDGVSSIGVLYMPTGSQLAKKDGTAYHYAPAGWSGTETEAPTKDTLRFTCTPESTETETAYYAYFWGTDDDFRGMRATATYTGGTALPYGTVMYAFVNINTLSDIVYTTSKTVSVGTVVWKKVNGVWSHHAVVGTVDDKYAGQFYGSTLASSSTVTSIKCSKTDLSSYRYEFAETGTGVAPNRWYCDDPGVPTANIYTVDRNPETGVYVYSDATATTSLGYLATRVCSAYDYNCFSLAYDLKTVKVVNGSTYYPITDISGDTYYVAHSMPHIKPGTGSVVGDAASLNTRMGIYRFAGIETDPAAIHKYRWSNSSSSSVYTDVRNPSIGSYAFASITEATSSVLVSIVDDCSSDVYAIDENDVVTKVFTVEAVTATK